jgi:hypothetical protein
MYLDQDLRAHLAEEVLEEELDERVAEDRLLVVPEDLLELVDVYRSSASEEREKERERERENQRDLCSGMRRRALPSERSPCDSAGSPSPAN